jgi:hypothetical protein
LNPERLSVDEARAFWAHPSQHVGGSTPETLPDGDGVQYWASGPICGVFHLAPWPGVWMAHYGAKPEGRGRLIPHARAVMLAFWEAEQPERVIGWTRVDNRLAVAFARRLGFVVDGRMALPSGDLILQGWTP